MRRALVSPLLSGLMPGLGQLFNRQQGMGAMLILGVSIVALAALFLFSQAAGRAIASLESVPKGEEMAALSAAFRAQDLTWLLVVMAVFFIIWIFAVVDAWRVGRKLDAKEREKA